MNSQHQENTTIEDLLGAPIGPSGDLDLDWAIHQIESEHPDNTEVDMNETTATNDPVQIQFADQYDELYDRLNRLPEGERKKMLRDLVPPAALFSKLDGTMFRIRALGLTMFDTKWMLENAGIQNGDPRAKVFKYLRGSLIDEEIPNELRNIAARQTTVAKQAGAFALPGDDKRSKQWWVPINATSTFTAAIQALIGEFDAFAREKLLDPYDEIRDSAKARFSEAVEAAWESMQATGKTGDMTREQFVASNEQFFNAQFPSRTDLEMKLRMEFFPTQPELPPIVEQTVMEIRNTMRQKALADKAAAEAQAQAAQAQLRIADIQRQMAEQAVLAAQKKEEDERRLRAKILHDAMAPEIAQAHNIALQIQSTFIKLAQQVLEDVRHGRPISSAKRRSWRQTLSQLQPLVTGDTSALQRALETLEQVSEADSTSETIIASAEKDVQAALQEIERVAAISVHSDALWLLIRSGKANEAMSRILQLRQKLNEQLWGLDAMEEMAARIGGEQMAIDAGLVGEKSGQQAED